MASSDRGLRKQMGSFCSFVARSRWRTLAGYFYKSHVETKRDQLRHGREISAGSPPDLGFVLYHVGWKGDQGTDPSFHLGLDVAIARTKWTFWEMGSVAIQLDARDSGV